MKKSFAVDTGWLLVPSTPSDKRHKVVIEADGMILHDFDLPVPEDNAVDWWPAIDLRDLRGREIQVSCDCEAFFQLAHFVEEKPAMESLYQEKRRPQFHFSPQRGWLNDPNGLVYFQGEYHLFFQYNPYFTEWGNMHWGHAVSTDLVHWRELDIALYPDAHGAMFSGSAVVDHQNTSGLGDGATPPIVFLYTANREPCTQCAASSTDGRRLVKYPGNPVIPEIGPSNRDPKVFWDKLKGRWMMVLYVPHPTSDLGADGKPIPQHAIHFLSSSDLLQWRPESITFGGVGEDIFLCECPDFFPLPVTGEKNSTQWVICGANAEYQVGTFDGQSFFPTAPKSRAAFGHSFFGDKVFYAAQSYSDEPRGRRVMIGWLIVPSPGMPFNQCMSVPVELSLHRTAEGLRLAYWPVEEINSLRRHSQSYPNTTLNEGHSLFELDTLDSFDLTLHLAPASTGRTAFIVRDLTLIYDASTRELSGGEITLSIPASIHSDGPSFRLLGDRTSIEVFAADGQVYWPIAALSDVGVNTISIRAETGVTVVQSATIHEMAGIWN